MQTRQRSTQRGAMQPRVASRSPLRSPLSQVPSVPPLQHRPQSLPLSKGRRESPMELRQSSNNPMDISGGRMVQYQNKKQWSRRARPRTSASQREMQAKLKEQQEPRLVTPMDRASHPRLAPGPQKAAATTTDRLSTAPLSSSHHRSTAEEREQTNNNYAAPPSASPARRRPPPQRGGGAAYVPRVSRPVAQVRARQRLCEVWLVRHGETEANANRIAQGQQPGRLTRTGALQAAALGQRLRSEHEARPFDAVLCSDLLRCRQTASLALGPWEHHAQPPRTTAGEPIRVHFDQGLRERSVGIYEGHAHDAPRPQRPSGVHPREYRVPRGESWEDVQVRASRLLARLGATYLREDVDAPRRVLVFTHGGFIMECVNAARGADGVNVPFMTNGAMNTAIYKIELVPNGGPTSIACRLVTANDAQHLMPQHLSRYRREAQALGSSFDLQAESPPYNCDTLDEAWWAPPPASSGGHHHHQTP